MGSRVRAIYVVAFLLEAPRRGQPSRAAGFGSAELSSALARSGESRDRAAGQVDAPNRVTLCVGHKDRVVRRDQALRMIEARRSLCAIEQTGLAAAVTIELLAVVVEQNDLIMPAVGQRPSLLATRYGFQFSRKKKTSLGFL